MSELIRLDEVQRFSPERLKQAREEALERLKLYPSVEARRELLRFEGELQRREESRRAPVERPNTTFVPTQESLAKLPKGQNVQAAASKPKGRQLPPGPARPKAGEGQARPKATGRRRSEQFPRREGGFGGRGALRPKG